MAKPRRSRRTLTTLVVLSLVSVTAITLDGSGKAEGLISGTRSLASDIFTPVRTATDAIIDPIGDFFAGAFNYAPLSEQNHRLIAENGRLRLQVAERHAAKNELDQVMDLANLPFLGQLPTVPSQVVSIDDSDFAATVSIDKGRDDGVTLGDPVVGAGGLVGQVVQAEHHTAVVRLVTDGSSRVGVTFGAGQFATVVGSGPRRELTADFVSTGSAIHVGEQLNTNGLAGGQYPPGIPVATVTSVKTVAGADQQTVRVRPVANLDALTYLDVVQWSPVP